MAPKMTILNICGKEYDIDCIVFDKDEMLINLDTVCGHRTDAG